MPSHTHNTPSAPTSAATNAPVPRSEEPPARRGWADRIEALCSRVKDTAAVLILVGTLALIVLTWVLIKNEDKKAKEAVIAEPGRSAEATPAHNPSPTPMPVPTPVQVSVALELKTSDGIPVRMKPGGEVAITNTPYQILPAAPDGGTDTYFLFIEPDGSKKVVPWQEMQDSGFQWQAKSAGTHSICIIRLPHGAASSQLVLAALNDSPPPAHVPGSVQVQVDNTEVRVAAAQGSTRAPDLAASEGAKKWAADVQERLGTIPGATFSGLSFNVKAGSP